MESVMALLQTVIYTISTGLLYPVMAGLVALVGWALVYCGGFFPEWLLRSRRRRFPGVAQRLDEIGGSRQVPQEVQAALSQPVRRFLLRLTELIRQRDGFFPQRVENLIQCSEHDLTRHVDRLRLVVRMGPGLGLMATLIPMGTGLAALGQGNFSQVSSSLIIAFTSTVVGLFVGILAQIFATLRGRWVEEDILAMELLAEALAGQLPAERGDDRAAPGGALR